MSSCNRVNKQQKQHIRVSEKYYDCLQCAEQCRHTNSSNPSNFGNSIKNSSNNRNDNNNGTNSNAHGSFNKSSNDERAIERNNAVNVERFSGSCALATSSKNLAVQKNSKKISAVGGCFGSDDFYKRKKSNSQGNGKNNNPKKLISRGNGQSTPAKKRSSLARPVRVHDSFVQSKKPMSMMDRHQQRTPSVHAFQRQSSSQDSGTITGCCCDDGLEERTDEENSWPIKLRLEEMLELTLSRGKRSRRMRTRKRKKMMLTSKYGHFKDTERLLKVLSVNNVDQDNRHNVKRCSVM